MKYTFKIFVNKEGNIPKQASIDIKEVLKTFAKKNIRITIEKWSNKRSNLQNAWYWGVAINMIVEKLIEYNPVMYADITPEAVHEWLKDQFLDKRLISIAGIEKEISGSTIDLTTTNFMAYKEDIQQFAAEKLGLDIPDPDPNYKQKGVTK